MKNHPIIHRIIPLALVVVLHAVSAGVANELVKVGHTRVSIVEGRWRINDQLVHAGTPAEGLLMNVRIVNCVFEDLERPDFDADANANEFIAWIPEYVSSGIRAFTICLQGGYPGYEGAVNSAFRFDGSLRASYLKRVRRVIEACDRHGAVVILSCFYQWQDQHFDGEDNIRAALVGAVRWIRERCFSNVVLEVTNEFGHSGFNYPILKTASGQVELIRLAKKTAPKLLVSTSGGGGGGASDSVAHASDFLLVHYNNTHLKDIPHRIAALKNYGKPIVCNEDDKVGADGAKALELSVHCGASWGFMHEKNNQHFPFHFKGMVDDAVVYTKLRQLTMPKLDDGYFPPPESKGGWRKVKSPEDLGLDGDRLQEARDYALTGGGSGYITRHGKLVLSWGDARRRYDLKSTTKSIGVTALALAIKDSKIRLADKATKYHPGLENVPGSNKETDWLKTITIQHLATQTAGFEKGGGYEKLVFAPGTRWLYSDGGPNWLAECVTLAYRRDLKNLMFERVFMPLGITQKDLTWRQNLYRPKAIEGIPRREFGSGISANVDAMARIGYLYLRCGKWKDRQIIPEDFVTRARTTVRGVVGLPEHQDTYNSKMGNASDHYGLLWWNNADGTLEDIPLSTYWSWGLYDSLIVVFPELDIVVARAGKSWKRGEGAKHYDVLRPFLEPIAASVKDRAKAVGKVESEEGFVSLFDGKTLNGWQGATEHWAAEEGSLVFIRKGAARSKKELLNLKLMSTKEYSDFILRFDIKLPKESNNGVAIRAPLEGDPAFVGMEIQVQDPQYYRKLKDYEAFGSVYGIVPAKTGHLQPNGQWNTEEILCIDKHVKVTLNGTVIVDVDLESIGENTKDGADHPGLERTKGHIGFCGHTGRVEYRDIRIKDLTNGSTN